MNKKEEYQESMSNVIDVMSELDQKTIAEIVLNVFNRYNSEMFFNLKDDSNIMSLIEMSVVKGYIVAHTKTELPTPIMIVGSITKSVDDFISLFKNEKEEKEND